MDFSSRRGHPQRKAGITLVELLVVIGIIGILAAMLLPALGRFKRQTKIHKARLEMDQIISAITEYELANGRFPISREAARAAKNLDDDLTYGGVIENTHTWIAGPAYLTNNCELMAVLLDLEYYGDGTPTINQGHVKNPGRIKFLSANMPGGTNASPGVGVDGVYRDPWGGPYMITLDLNGDGRARDCFYRKPAVSENPKDPAHGLNGLVRTGGTQGNAFFEANAPVLVWSVGPDRHLDDRQKADQGVNRDNILSWKR